MVWSMFILPVSAVYGTVDGAGTAAAVRRRCMFCVVLLYSENGGDVQCF